MAVTNEFVYNLFTNKGKEHTINFLVESHQVNGTDKPDKRSYRYKFVKMLNERASIIKRGNRVPEEVLQKFLETPFSFPSVAKKKPSVQHDPVVKEAKESTLLDVNKSICKELSDLKHETTKITNVREKIDVLTDKVIKLDQVDHRNKTLKLENKCLKSTVKIQATKLRNVKGREEYYRKKMKEKENKIKNKEADVDSFVKDFEEMLDEYRETIIERNDLRSENEWLREYLSSENQSEVNLYDEDKSRYTEACQNCVYSLLENHVPLQNVGPVIETVLGLAEKRANRLPSTSTVANMNIQRLVISQKQIATSVSEQENTSLLSDETSKYGKKYMGYHVADSDGRCYVLGLRDIATKSAKDTLDTFKEILFDIDSRINTTQSEISLKLLAHIRNTVTDKAACELKFNKMLELYRKDILPLVYKDWEQMPPDDQQCLSKLNNFFCGLHSLVHIAETAEKTLKETESGQFDQVPIFDSHFKKASESGTVRLIRTACKAFSYGGDDKSGCHGPFMTYIAPFLTEHNMRALPITRFRGNRFNILFYNAGVVYFFHEKMIDFLQNHKSCAWVLHDLTIPFFVAGTKSLGLISKFITTPLWNIIERKDITVLQANDYYANLIQYLEKVAREPSILMKGTETPFKDETKVKKDAIYESLLAPSKHDVDVEIILRNILPAISKLLEVQFKDHLEGGVFENPTSDLVATTKSAPKHNKFSESVFAYLDGLLRSKPHISTISAEAYIMFSLNKTSEWLQSQNISIYNDARTEARSLHKAFMQRKQEIMDKKLVQQREAFEKAEQSRKRKLHEMEIQTQDIVFYGLWQSKDHISSTLATFNTESEKKDALKAQLRFRKNILKQHHQDKVYNFTVPIAGTKRRKDLSVEELVSNLEKLIEHAFTLPMDHPEGSPMLVGKRVQHRFIEEGREKLYFGKVISQVSNRIRF